MTPEIKSKKPTINEVSNEKNKLSEKQAGSQEDWEGGASRPTDENVPAEILPAGSPSKDLQAQAESVPKTVSGDNGPPKNLQSLPTQDTHDATGEPVAVPAEPEVAPNYKCPVCSEEIERDLALFLDHGKQHVIDSIQKTHPEWVEKNGACSKCVNYFEESIQPEASEKSQDQTLQK